MRPEELYLRDIVFACRSIATFVKGVSAAELAESDLIDSAVQHKLMVIGEASRNISKRIKNAYPNVDWPSISGFRNILVHEYFSLDREIVWKTIQNDILSLDVSVREILRTEYPHIFATLDSN